jgi:hypothetical protein
MRNGTKISIKQVDGKNQLKWTSGVCRRNEFGVLQPEAEASIERAI